MLGIMKIPEAAGPRRRGGAGLRAADAATHPSVSTVLASVLPVRSNHREDTAVASVSSNVAL